MRSIQLAGFAVLFLASSPPSAAEECWSPDRYYGCLVGEGVIATWHGSDGFEALMAADEICAPVNPGPPPSTYSEACGEYADTRWYVRQKAANIIDYAATLGF